MRSIQIIKIANAMHPHLKTIMYALSFSIILGTASCSEDFVNVTNPDALSTENYPGSVNDLEQLLTGVYGSQHVTGLYGHNMFGKILYMWSHTADLSWQGTPTWIALAQNNSQPNDGFLNATWQDSWVGVQRSNTLLANLATYREELAKDAELESLNLMEGQAYFLRAWYYYNLINIWGESFIIDGQGGNSKGVPIVTDVSSSLDETQLPRASVREVWDFMIADLKEAERLLEGNNWSGNDIFKADIWAVKGFLGKAYVYTQDWNNAQTYLNDVITNSGKSLVPFDTYKEMFNGKNEFNSESLFELNLNVDMTARGGTATSMGSSVGMVLAPSFVGDNGTAAASAWSNVFPHEKNIQRFGFDEGHYFPQGTEQVSPDNVDPAYVSNSIAARENQTVDPRLWVSCLQPYVDSMIVSGGKRAISHYLDIHELDMEAWSFRKYINLEGTETEINMANGSNMYWLRLADIYLLYAETLINNGNSSEALEYINKVKRRAYGYPVDGPSPVDYSSLSASTMASDPVLMNDPLKYERWAELFGEGHWWFDVRRWQIGDQEADYYERVRGGTIQWEATDYAQPIPILELNANVAMEQNPGY